MAEMYDSGRSAGDEIEVTPEMIEAGLSELMSFNRERDIYEEKVRSIYLAMARARRPLSKSLTQNWDAGYTLTILRGRPCVTQPLAPILRARDFSPSHLVIPRCSRT